MLTIFFKNRTNALRVAVYPVAVLALVALVYVGWIHEPEADIAARLSGAEMLALSGAYDLAEKELVAVFDAEPRNRHGWLIQGLIDERRKNNEAAIKSYRAALQATDEPELARDIRLSIADLFRRLERPDEMHQELTLIEAKYGRLAAIERMRGVSAWQDKEYATARSLFRQAKKIEPLNREIDSLSAGTLIDQARHDEALRILKEIPADEASAWPYWQTLARSYMEAGDDEGAKVALAKYVQLDQRGRALLKNDEFWSQHVEVAQLDQLLSD